MHYLVLKVWTQSASFRIPEFQNFHKSFLLPPPTTMIGFAGAALGFSAKKAQEFFHLNNIKLGISGKSEGMAKDLWKYNDFKNGSVIKREIYFNNKYLVFFSSEEMTVINELKNKFENPIYALTLGNSDALAKVKIINSFVEGKSFDVENCLLENDVINEVMDNIDNGLNFSIYSTSDPILYDLPTEFYYESDYGVRKVIKRKKYSFITKKMKLNIAKKGIFVDDKFIPMISIH